MGIVIPAEVGDRYRRIICPASDITLHVDGAMGDTPWVLDGSVRREHVTVGEWAWARSGVFVGTVPVEGCEAGEPIP